jgi:hypothetical protein
MKRAGLDRDVLWPRFSIIDVEDAERFGYPVIHVKQETLIRWGRIQREYNGMQTEMRRLYRDAEARR